MSRPRDVTADTAANSELYPDNDTGNVLRQIRKGGSDMSRPMEMDFHVAVPSERAGRLVAARCEAEGFTVELTRDSNGPNWTCTCTKSIVPTYATVSAIEAQMNAFSRDVGGYADGFGTFGNLNTPVNK